MVSKFLTDLPVKGSPKNNDIVLIQDIDAATTSVVSLSNLRDYMFSYQVPQLSASNFTAVSANFTYLDITQYELSGFSSTGNVYISGDLMVAKLVKVDNNGNSSDWYGSFTAVNPNSAKWNSNWTTTNSNSGRWDSNWTTTNSNSADWESAWSYVNALPTTLTTTLCAMSGDGVTPFTLTFTNGLLTGIGFN